MNYYMKFVQLLMRTIFNVINTTMKYPGKSSLINALAKRPAAIVSPIAGTTRDVVEVRMDLNGVACIVSDTAGLRELTADPIEQEGIKRAREVFRDAQLKLFVCDSSDKGEVHAAEAMLTVQIKHNLLSPVSVCHRFLRNSNCYEKMSTKSCPPMLYSMSKPSCFSFSIKLIFEAQATQKIS